MTYFSDYKSKHNSMKLLFYLGRQNNLISLSSPFYKMLTLDVMTSLFELDTSKVLQK